MPTRRISPTDISQFIRLEQCQRYLYLRLKERVEGRDFLYSYGVAPLSIPPILTRSGANFEKEIETSTRAAFPLINFQTEVDRSSRRQPNNLQVVELAKDLHPGEILCLFQVRLDLQIAGWAMRGDADIVRLWRDKAGQLQILVADMKSSTTARVEHRLQVAFYQLMLANLFREEGLEYAEIRTAILYRGGPEAMEKLSELELATQQSAALEYFNAPDSLLEFVADQTAYLEAVEDLVTGENSLANRISEEAQEDLPYHLTHKCDGCLYNEYCMKGSAERDDLSLLPHLTALDKEALRRNGLKTVRQLSLLKDLKPDSYNLTPVPGQEALSRKLATTWPVGPRLDELVHRARRYRQWKKDEITALPFIPSKGHGSLPHSGPEHNPNLVKIYIEAQEDSLLGRLYMVGALVVTYEGGEEKAERASVVEFAPAKPETAEEEQALLARWIERVLEAVVTLASPDLNGEKRAPIHLIFYDRFAQKTLLDGLSRHLPSLLGATPLYDFMTQLAAFDSPIASYLEEEIRELKNYPMLCQSLQAVAAYLKFDWNKGEKYREIFKARLFDFWRKLDESPNPGENLWYTGRARFSSQLPLEFAYAAWNELDPPGREDLFSDYRAATPALIQGFAARRLEALEHIAKDFKGNHLTQKSSFLLPDLENFRDKARTLAHALEEFVSIERHVELAGWKATRNLAPERRVLLGETLQVRYLEEDQFSGVAEQNRENLRRSLLREELGKAQPGIRLTKEQSTPVKWSQERQHFHLRLDTENLDCDLTDVLALSGLREGDSIILYPRYAYDSRLPEAERTPNTPTPKQMLYGNRAEIIEIATEKDELGRVQSAILELEMLPGFGQQAGFVFMPISRPLQAGELYTLDSDPNSWYAYWCLEVAQGLVELEEGAQLGYNALYERLVSPAKQSVNWPVAAGQGQTRFVEGLAALEEVGALHGFEPGKREYIGSQGNSPALLVQGPPGTGKSYSTGFAVFARMQGAMTAGLPFRVLLSCKTHAATEVLLGSVREVQHKLRELQIRQPEIFATYFDPRLLEVPLYRVAGREKSGEGIIPLAKDADKEKGEPNNFSVLNNHAYCVAGVTPGGIRGIVKTVGKKNLFNSQFCHCLVLDEASQMNLPEAAMAALPLYKDGQLIVVGDPRQMPPIIKHDWDSEPRRTFQEYQSYQSLFNTLRDLNPPPPQIKFEESFRLHSVMAEFLREEIYSKDGINYHSNKVGLLPTLPYADEFIRAVLDTNYPLVVVVHNEAASQNRNLYEQVLVAPLLEVLSDKEQHGLNSLDGLGVVVPHRAQRAEMQKAFPMLAVVDELSGKVLGSAVDTVERFQGGERQVILVSATESDRDYLLAAGDFLFDPRRLTVAISRAKQKLVLVASHSIFSLFSPEEEAFANSQLWKNLLRHTCNDKLWEGERHGQKVEVWGKRAEL